MTDREMTMSDETNDRLIVLPRWKLLFLLIVGMFVPVCVEVALCCFVMLKCCGGDTLPVVIANGIWIFLWAQLTGSIVSVALAVSTK